MFCLVAVFFFFKQKTAYEMRISDWSSDVCSSDLAGLADDVLALVPHALALVRLGLAEVADLGGHLADLLLVDAADHDLGGGRDLEGDAVGGLVVDGVAVAQCQLEGARAGVQDAVAHADDLELRSEEHTSELQSLMRISYAA